MLFLCSDTTNRQYCLIAYRTTEIPTLYYLEGLTKELVSPFKFILPSDKNMPTSQRSVLQGSPFVRLAGFSGFSACVMLLYKNHLSTKLPEPRTWAEMKLSLDKLLAEAGLLEARMKNLASSDADATNKIEEVEKTKRRIENNKEEVNKRTRRINELMKQQFNVTVYDYTNNCHFLHTFALFAAPLARKPALTGTLMFGGMILR